MASLDIPRHTCGGPHGRRGVWSAPSTGSRAGGRNLGFPYRPPTVPRGVEVPKEPPSLGPDYETDWARNPVARWPVA